MSGGRRGSDTRQSNGHLPSAPFIIGVAGGTASGKSTVCKRIMEKLGQEEIDQRHRRVVCISQDSFYRNLTPEESEAALRGQINFDHPDQFDDSALVEALVSLRNGKPCQVPIYDYKTNARLPESRTIYPADVVLCEGILVFYQPEVRALFDMKLFVDTDADTRLSRRVRRDTQERGRELEHVLDQYTRLVKPAFEEFCLPTKKFADVIIPRGADNTVAISLIVQHIADLLLQAGERHKHHRQQQQLLSNGGGHQRQQPLNDGGGQLPAAAAATTTTTTAAAQDEEGPEERQSRSRSDSR